MAQVTGQERKIDKLLELSRADWEEPPKILAELEEWSHDDLMSYTAELPLWNDRLQQLDRYAEQGHMTQEQARKYRNLKELVASNRPILDRILHSHQRPMIAGERTLDPEYLKKITQQAQINPQIITAMERAATNWQRNQIDPQILKVIKQTVKNVQRPEIQEYVRSALHFRELAEQQAAAIPWFRLPPAALRPSIAVNENAVRAAIAAANSVHSEQLRRVTEQFARSVTINLPPEALASAQFTSLQRFLVSSLPDATKVVSQSALTIVQERYAETLRNTAGLLANVDIRRMIEFAESEGLIEEAMETAQETGVSMGEVTAEEIEPLSLDLESAVDALLPYVAWAILLLSVALAVSYSNPSFAQYKDPLTQAVIWLTILERALKKARKTEED